MKLVYSNENYLLVNNVRNLIEAQGIETFIKNEFAQSAVGEISAFDSWPEVWVVNDSDLERAQNIVAKSLGTCGTADWICNNCLEINAPSFEICWNCQSENS